MLNKPFVYYNETDTNAAQWLKELIKAKLIPNGMVDTRSVWEVAPEDLTSYSQHHFFAGIGGWAYALQLAGWPVDRPVWTGSCPCQPFSSAGKGAGFADERHLWPAWQHLIRVCRPPVIFGEQVEAAINHGWLDLVQDDLEGEDYAFGAVGLPAASVGTPHIRRRLWFVANTNGTGLAPRNERNKSRTAQKTFAWSEFERVHAANTWREWDAESAIRVFTHGVSPNVGRVRGYGNAIVPQVAAEIIKAYMTGHANG